MLGSHAEAEEVAQEAFLRAHRALGDFRGDARLGTWLYAIASRLCLNRLASGPRRHEQSDEVALLRRPAEGGDAATAFEQRELQAALHEAIASLPEDRRLVVILRDVELTRLSRNVVPIVSRRPDPLYVAADSELAVPRPLPLCYRMFFRMPLPEPRRPSSIFVIL